MKQTIISYTSDDKKIKDKLHFEASNYIKLVKQTVIIFNTDNTIFEIGNDKRFKSISYKLTPKIKGHKIYVANSRDSIFFDICKEVLPELKDRLIIINGNLNNEIFNYIISFKEKNNLDFVFNNNSIFAENKTNYLNAEKELISSFSILNDKILNKNDFDILTSNLYDLDGLGIFITCELSRLHCDAFLKVQKESKVAPLKYITPIYYYNNSISVNNHVFENFIDEILTKNDFINFSKNELKSMFKISE